MRRSLLFVLVAGLAVAACKESASNKNTASNNANTNPTTVAKVPPPLKPEAPPDPNFKQCNQYFPLVPGSIQKYVLTYSSGAVADVTVVVDAAEENGKKIFVKRTQIIDRTGGAELVQSTVAKFICDGERIQILSESNESNVNGMESRSEFKFRPDSVAMLDEASMERKGSTWQHGFTQNFFQKDKPPAIGEQPTIIVFTVEGKEEVTLPIGKFNAVKVLRKVGTNSVTDYFVRGLGLVKRQAAEGTAWELKEYSGLKAT